jgi:partner of Y14 and mago protein
VIPLQVHKIREKKQEKLLKIYSKGETFIPASRRPDGTWRKPIKVKDGYIPQEEVPVYETKASQVKTKQDEYRRVPPGAVFVEPVEVKKSQKDEKQKKEKKPSKLEIESIESQMKSIEITNSKILEKRSTNANCDDEIVKKVRKLKKSLRQIEELEEKLKMDKDFKLEKEQMEKINRKADLISELKELGENVDE